MEWWVLEVVKVALLVVLAVGLHLGIRRFGKRYVADIFQATPGVGRSFLILADFAIYLIFAAYALFNVRFVRPEHWSETVGGQQLEAFVFSIAGIALIIGVLHGINVILLPFIGSILALRERLSLGPPRRETPERELAAGDGARPVAPRAT